MTEGLNNCPNYFESNGWVSEGGIYLCNLYDIKNEFENLNEFLPIMMWKIKIPEGVSVIKNDKGFGRYKKLEHQYIVEQVLLCEPINYLDDEPICNILIQQVPKLLQHIHHQTAFQSMTAVQKVPKMLEHVQCQTINQAKTAVEKCPSATIQLVDRTLFSKHPGLCETLWKLVLQKNGMFLGNLLSNEVDLKYLMDQEIPNVHFAQKNEKDESSSSSLRVAIKNDGKQESTILDKLKEIAIQQNPMAIQYIENPSETLWKQAIGKKPIVFRLIQKKTHDIIMFALQLDGNNIQYVKRENQTLKYCLTALHTQTNEIIFKRWTRNYRFTPFKPLVRNFPDCFKFINPRFLPKCHEYLFVLDPRRELPHDDNNPTSESMNEYRNKYNLNG